MPKPNKSAVNENRLFQKLQYFFTTPSKVLCELAQNAQRAGADKFDVTLAGNNLKVTDNGKGLADANSLVVLADSAWSKKCEEEQNPAGWGLFYLYSLCESVVMKSAYGSLHIDCPRLFEDSEYRTSLLDQVNAKDVATGFSINAVLKEKVADKMIENKHFLSYFPMQVTVNGKELPHTTAIGSFGRYDFITEYQGNKVCVQVSMFHPGENQAKWIATHTTVAWYGLLIKDYYSYSYAVAIDVTQNSPVTPVLPYRNDIQEDDKAQSFYEFLRKEVVVYCTNQINDLSKSDDLVFDCMKTMSAVGTQDEIDALERFYVTEIQQFYSHECEDGYPETLYPKKGEGTAFVSKIPELHLVIDGKTEVSDYNDLEGQLCLPAGALTEFELSKNHPSWLSVTGETVVIKVEHGEEFEGNYSWANAEISGVDVPVLALMIGSCEGTIFYTNTPNDIDGIQASIFNSHIYSDDSDDDSRNSQEYYFNEDIAADIRKMTNEYPKSELFKGFAGIEGVNIHKITALSITGKTLTVVNEDGSIREVALAA